jgi:hypothetical protein
MQLYGVLCGVEKGRQRGRSQRNVVYEETVIGEAPVFHGFFILAPDNE